MIYAQKYHFVRQKSVRMHLLDQIAKIPQNLMNESIIIPWSMGNNSM